jgi:hypothetical protein
MRSPVDGGLVVNNLVYLEPSCIRRVGRALLQSGLLGSICPSLLRSLVCLRRRSLPSTTRPGSRRT